jgi:hypothetical protein
MTYPDQEIYDPTPPKPWPPGPFVLRFALAVLVAAALGWVLQAFAGQLGDLALRIGLAAAIAMALYLLVTNLTWRRGARFITSLAVAAAFSVAFWAPWLLAEFGGLPASFAEASARAEQTRYDLTSFGQPVVLEGWIMFMWLAITGGIALVPLCAGIAKPSPHNNLARVNPFSDPARDRKPLMALFGYPIVAFLAAAAVTYLFDWFGDWGVPTSLSSILILLPMLLMIFPVAGFTTSVIAALLVGAAGVLGYWVPWLVKTYGQDGAMAFLTSGPSDMIAAVRAMAEEFGGYELTTSGSTSVYSDGWTFVIWAATTLALAGLPLLVVLGQRFFYKLRWN